MAVYFYLARFYVSGHTLIKDHVTNDALRRDGRVGDPHVLMGRFYEVIFLSVTGERGGKGEKEGGGRE